MEDTSERIIVDNERNDEADYYIYLLHLASYEYALLFAKEKKVLDYGCGTGYGEQILSSIAKSIIGIDISEDAINYAQNNYKNQKVQYLKIGKGNLPFDDESFDLVISFQVIEHILDPIDYLIEIKRVLKPNGLLLLTTPDRNTRLFPFQKPWNFYHIKEYSRKSLNFFLSGYFAEIEILKIGGEQSLVKNELQHRQFTKLVTLPFTLIIYPDLLRKFFLRILKRIYYSKPRILTKNNEILKYSTSDIIFSHQIKNHTDLMAICKKK